jgi:hypothetical protein
LILGSVPLAAFAPTSYEISVGTLSDVIPFPPGHVLIISTSSGVDVYTAATLFASQSLVSAKGKVIGSIVGYHKMVSTGNVTL